jgi:hypothetical protein
VLGVLLLAVVLLGCASHRATQGLQSSEAVKTLIIRDTVRDTLITRDTVSRFQNIYRQDSTVTRIKGDTVFVDRWHTYIEKNDQLQAHTAKQANQILRDVYYGDTVRIPVPVERKLTKWEKLKQDVGGLALGALGVAFVGAAIWFYRRLRLYARGKL